MKKKNLKNQTKWFNWIYMEIKNICRTALMFAFPERKLWDIYNWWQFLYTWHKMVCVIPPPSPGEDSAPVCLWVFHCFRPSIFQLQEELISRKTHGPWGPIQGLEKAVTQASDNQCSNLDVSTMEPEHSETHIKALLMIEAQLIFII